MDTDVTITNGIEQTNEGAAPSRGRIVAPDQDRVSSRSRLHALSRNKWFLRLIFYGAIVIAFQIMAITQGPFFLPTIPQILTGMVELFTDGYVLVLGPTLQQLAIGFVVAMAVAIPLGALMGRFRFAEDLLAPWVNTVFVTSKESLLPIIILIFGLGFGYRVTVVVLFAIFFPVINTAAGVRYVEKELRETAEAFATPPWRMFTQVYVPAAAPFIVAGVRMGLAMAIKGMVIAEIWVRIGTGELLGAFTLAPRRLDLYYALAFVIIMVAIGLNGLLRVAERRLTPYAQTAKGAQI